MPRNASTPLVALALFALSLAPVINTAAAGDWSPIFEETPVAFIISGDSVYVAHVHRKTDLEQAHNASASVDTLRSVITQAPAATSQNELVIYGGYAAGQAATDLESKGYDTRSDDASSFTGADYDATYTD